MTLKQLCALVALSAAWGGSFLFIRVAAPVMGPFVLMAARVMLAAVALWLFALARGASIDVRPYWKRLAVLGLINAAAPFALIAWAELRISASMSAILVAGIPLVVAALSGRSVLASPRRVAGLALGISGVGVLVGWSPMPLDARTLASVALCVVATVSYGFGAVYAKRRLADAPVLTLAFGQQLSAAVWLLVPGLVTLPRVAPSAAAILALLALALVSTALAYVLFFWLLASAGAVKSSTSAFLIPAFGVLWGSLFLGERPTSGVLGGLACVLVSLVLVNGLPRFGGTTLEARTVDIRS